MKSIYIVLAFLFISISIIQTNVIRKSSQAISLNDIDQTVSQQEQEQEQQDHEDPEEWINHQSETDLEFHKKFTNNFNDQIQANIVGGAEVQPRFKYGNWMVAIMRNKYQFCAGSIIAPNLMVTAAHCSVLGIPLNLLRVVAHRHDLSLSDEEEQGIVMGVAKINVHKDFNLRTLENDIAVWELTGGDSLVNPIALDTGVYSAKGKTCKTIGWGATSEGGDGSDLLLEVTLSIVDLDVCKRALRSELGPGMVCAGGKAGKDACQGDSGGPMIASKRGKPVLVGVVSWGKGCARRGYPGVYTRVSMYRDWLAQFTSVQPQPPVEEPEEEAEEAVMLVDQTIEQ